MFPLGASFPCDVSHVYIIGDNHTPVLDSRGQSAVTLQGLFKRLQSYNNIGILRCSSKVTIPNIRKDLVEVTFPSPLQYLMAIFPNL